MLTEGTSLLIGNYLKIKSELEIELSQLRRKKSQIDQKPANPNSSCQICEEDFDHTHFIRCCLKTCGR